MTLCRDEPDDPGFARYRAYLRILATISIDPRLHMRFDTSEVVEQTMLRAIRDWGEHDGQSEEEWFA